MIKEAAEVERGGGGGQMEGGRNRESEGGRGTDRQRAVITEQGGGKREGEDRQAEGGGESEGGKGTDKRKEEGMKER